MSFTQQRLLPPGRLSALIVFLSFLVPLAVSPAQAQDSGRFLRWAYQDAGSIAQKATSSTALYAVGGALLLSPVSLLDQPISDNLTLRYETGGALGGYLDVVNELGGKHMSWVSAGVFGISLLTDDEKFQDAAFTSMESLVYSGLMSYGLKHTVGRVRPEDTGSAFQFQPFSGSTSFPSGHTNAAFAVLTPWALYYPSPWTKGLLVLGAGGTAIARISLDKHWPTDVIAGGALGFFTAYHLTKRHQRERGAAPGGVDARLALTPTMGDAAPVMVSLKVTF